VAAGIATNFSDKRIPQKGIPPKKIKWGNMLIFLALFGLAGWLSETASNQNWKYRKPLNLFENNYRFGSLVFGGGDVLMPMMYEQYVVRPQSEHIVQTKKDVLQMQGNDFLTGSGIVRAIPGPVFSIGAFTGGMVMRTENSTMLQMIGCFLGAVAIFLPSALLVLFFFPVWHNLKKYAVIFRSLEGINAAVVGIMAGATFYLGKDIMLQQVWAGTTLGWLNVGIIGIVFSLLSFTKVRPPLIVIGCLAVGWFL
jgi:chromate transporter